MQQLKYCVLLISCRLNVEPHDSLVQQLVSEAWLRIDRYCDRSTFIFFLSYF